MKEIIALGLSYTPLLAFTASAIWCLRNGHIGFAITFTVLAAIAMPSVSIGGEK